MRLRLRGGRCAFVQLESALDVVAAATKIARSEGVQRMLDPAPAQPLSQDSLTSVDILTPNEIEASILLGVPPGRVSKEEAPLIARRLRERGPRAVVLKLGDQGCFYLDDACEIFSPGFRVNARDATAAGDVFNAALAV